MKKTLAVLMAALLVAACFATVGSAATPTASLSPDYTNVSLLEGAGTLDKLFDGDDRKEEALAWGTDDANVVAFKNADCKDAEANATLCLNIDLGEEMTLSGLTISFYKDYNVMIGLGEENTLTVSSSDDGTDYAEVKSFTFTSEALEAKPDNSGVDSSKYPKAGVYDYEFKFDSAITTQYLELKIPYEASHELSTDGKVIWEFIGMTEITFAEGEPADDTSSEPAGDTSEPADDTSSEAPATSSEAPAASSAPTSSTPPTGDAGFAAIAVVAVVALAGAALIVRKRS